MSSDAGHRLVGVVYVNNDPPQTAKILGDLKEDVSQRFSISLDQIRVLDEDGNVLKDDIEIMKAPPKFRVEIRQASGGGCMLARASHAGHALISAAVAVLVAGCRPTTTSRSTTPN